MRFLHPTAIEVCRRGWTAAQAAHRRPSLARVPAHTPRCWDARPEALAAAALVAGVVEVGWAALVLPTLIRAAVQSAVAVHEYAHAAAAGCPVQAGSRRPMHAILLRGLLPLQTLYLPGLDDPQGAFHVEVASLPAQRRRAVAVVGPAANAALVFLLAPLLWLVATLPSLLGLAIGALLLANLWILATSWTDYRCALLGNAGRLYCGNFGILAKRQHGEQGFLPGRFRRMAARLGEATDVRGQQAGGLAVMSATGRFVGRKIVNDKRGDLTRDLLGSFRRRAVVRRLLGARPQSGIFHLIGHYRYGTSSAPSVVETHWHRWQRPRRLPVWTVDGRSLIRRSRVVENLITHNGDFQAWGTPWASLPVGQLGDWLTMVLGEANRARGDSPKIAGMLDLLHTQGQWGASLRLGFALHAQTQPPPWYSRELTRIAERVFEAWVSARQTVRTGAPDQTAPAEEQQPRLAVIGCTSLAEVYAANVGAVEHLEHELWQASLELSSEWAASAEHDLRGVLHKAAEAFFLNDVYRATYAFMAGAEGTFGLMATTSLAPGAVALAADRQPLFIGADPEAGLLVYASEAAALKVVGDPDADGRLLPVPFRYDLRDGDVALLQVHEGTAENTVTLHNRYRDDAPVVERIGPERLGAAGRGARDALPAGAPRWISLRDNPYISAAAGVSELRRREDRVLTEMTDIPGALGRIRRAWDDPESPNRRTAAALAAALLTNAPSRGGAEPGDVLPQPNGIDLLLFGVENSLFLAQRFACDLARVFPQLRVQAVDAVAFCEDPDQHELDTGTVTLALSHSGQTFNTLDAVKFVRALHALGKAGPIFVMTGEVDTLMGAAVGQRVHAGAPWEARVLDTCAGWRTAEPATVSTAAMHATLTELLLHLMRLALAQRGDHARPFGLAADQKDVAQIDALAQLAIPRAASLLGCTAEGWQIKTDEREALRRQGSFMARMITEPALVFLFTAVHLFAMLWLGWNPMIGLDALLASTTALAVFDAGTSAGKLLLVILQTAYFLFAGVVFALLLRLVQRRPLWDRVYVGRTLVIGDDAWVKNLLSQYVSKLFSLAYEFAGFNAIHAADARTGDLLHSYGHRVTRGLLLFLGLPDGRWPGRERAEAAVCMTSCQVRGIQNLGSGAIVFGVGHNPVCAEKIDRFMLLGDDMAGGQALPWVLRGDWSALARKLQESRFASFERLLAAYVVFHAAAARTRDFTNRLVPLANLAWSPVFLAVKLLTAGRVRLRFGRWDLSRTQSGTRIATTAAPVSSYDRDPKDYLPPAERFGSLCARDACPPHLAPAPAPMLEAAFAPTSAKRLA
jgi:hypothetical protein